MFLSFDSQSKKKKSGIISNPDASSSSVPPSLIQEAPTRKASAVNRDSKWEIEEDELICHAWLNTSINLVRGKDCPGDKYWTRISKIYHSNATPKGYKDRTIDSLTSQWQYIQRKVNKYVGAVAQVEGLVRSGK